MTAFIIRRIILAIPTVLIVLIVCFLLSKQVPGDEVETYNGNNIEGSGSLQNDPKAYEESYKRTTMRLGLDKPLFYWSLLTKAHPDTLNRIVYLPQKKLSVKYLEKCGDWPLVQSYFNGIENTQIKVSKLNDSLKVWKSNVQVYLSSLKIREDKDMASAINQLKSADQLNILAKELDSLNVIHHRILSSTVSTRLLYPKFAWNGVNNQFHYWLSSLFNFRNNVSLIDSRPVMTKISEAIKWTLGINLLAFCLSVWLSVRLGKYLGEHKGSRKERMISNILFSAYTLPAFWIGSLCLVFLTSSEYAGWLNIFPAGGVGDLDSDRSIFINLLDILYHFILPVFCLSYPLVSYLSAHVRDGIMDVSREPYFITALSKGLTKKEAIKRHGLKNALFPLISLVGGILPSLISGSVIIEVLFNIPGMGRLIYNGILSRDWPLVFQVILITAGIVILAQLLVDILYRVFDPRVNVTE